MEEILNLDGKVPVYSIPFLHYEDGGFIDPKCHNLIDDCRKATIDLKGFKPSQLLKDREEFKMDYFDGMRYLFQKIFLKYIKDTYINLITKSKS